MAKLFNRVRVSTTTTGTGTITLGSATSNAYMSFSEAGVSNSDVVSYVIEDGTDFEYGTGTYTSSGTTLTRTVRKSKIGGTVGTTKLTLSGSAIVYIDAAVEDLATAAQGAKADSALQSADIGSTVQGFDAGLHAGLKDDGAKTANYTLTLADANGLVGHSFGDNNARTFTIPANSSVAFPIGTTITIYNAINTLTIAWGGSGNLIWVPSGGTGNRTLAQWGMCTAVKTDSDGWWISGVGLS